MCTKWRRTILKLLQPRHEVKNLPFQNFLKIELLPLWVSMYRIGSAIDIIIIHAIIITTNLSKFLWGKIGEQTQVHLTKEDSNLGEGQTIIRWCHQLLLEQLKTHLRGAHDLIPRTPQHLSSSCNNKSGHPLTYSLTCKSHAKPDENSSIRGFKTYVLHPG